MHVSILGITEKGLKSIECQMIGSWTLIQHCLIKLDVGFGDVVSQQVYW